MTCFAVDYRAQKAKIGSGRAAFGIKTQAGYARVGQRNFPLLPYPPGQVLAIDTIIDRVWGPSGGDRYMLRQVVRRLRSKIEPDPANPIYISTVPGLGYEMVMKNRESM